MAETISISLLEQKLKTIKAKDIMTTSVITTTKNTSLTELSKLMIDKRISGMPVVDKEGGTIIGIITKTDLFTIMGMIKSGAVIDRGQKACCNPTVEFAMSKQIVSIDEDTTLDAIIDTMSKNGTHTLPVTDNGKTVGVVGVHDVFTRFYAAIRELSPA